MIKKVVKTTKMMMIMKTRADVDCNKKVVQIKTMEMNTTLLV